MTDWSSRIAEIKSQSGLKSADLARILGVRSGLISEIEQGRSKNPSASFLERMVQKLKVNPKWLLSGELPIFNDSNLCTVHNLAESGRIRGYQVLKDRDPPVLPLTKDLGPGAYRIPVLDQAVSAGGGSDLADADELVGWVPVPRSLRRYGAHLTALAVRGDSMEPTLAEDDMVVCDTGGWDGDGIYVLRMNDASLVKRVSMRPSGYRVLSDNKAYEPFDAEPERDKVSIVGRVRCILKVVG